MSKIKKHALTVIAIAIVVAVALLIWSRKAVADPLSERMSVSALQSVR
jgi:hypothetical protein